MVVGIDPAPEGFAWAALSGRRVLGWGEVAGSPAGQIEALQAVLREHPARLIIIEGLSGYLADKARFAALARTERTVGRLEGALLAWGRAYRILPATEWRRALRVRDDAGVEAVLRLLFDLPRRANGQNALSVHCRDALGVGYVGACAVFDNQI